MADVTLDEASVNAIASQVFQRIVGSAIAFASLPVASEKIDAIYNADLSIEASISTTSGARLIFSIGCRKDETSILEADSITGLLSVNGEESSIPSLAVVTRVDADTVTVLVRASVMKELEIGGYDLEIREINGLSTIPKWESKINIRKTAGRINA